MYRLFQISSNTCSLALTRFLKQGLISSSLEVQLSPGNGFTSRSVFLLQEGTLITMSGKADGSRKLLSCLKLIKEGRAQWSWLCLLIQGMGAASLNENGIFHPYCFRGLWVRAMWCSSPRVCTRQLRAGLVSPWQWHSANPDRHGGLGVKAAPVASVLESSE